MKVKVLASSILAFALISLLLFLLAEPKELKEARKNAESFKESLLHSLRAADSISIVEHSWVYDFFTNDEGRFPDSVPQLEYLRVSLTEVQASLLVESIEKMQPQPKRVFSVCSFEPHHTIEITNSAGDKSYVRVCFSCRDTEWEEGSGMAPEPFQDVFQGFIEPLGFQASRDWRELANRKDQQVGPSKILHELIAIK